VGVTVLRQDGYIRVQGRCCEISETGLGIVVCEDLAALIDGEMVILDFSLPSFSSCSISIRALVRHRSGSRLGFELIAGAPGHREYSRSSFGQGLEEQTSLYIFSAQRTNHIN